MAVIDTHVHVFPPEVVAGRAKICEKDAPFALLYENPSARMVDGGGVAAYMEMEAVEAAFVTSFPFSDPGLVRLSNDYVIELHSGDARIKPFICVPVEDTREALREIERCDGRGMRGVGEIAFYGRGFGAVERTLLEPVAATLAERGLLLMLHVNEPVGHPYQGKTDMDFRELARLIERHPDLTFILSHMGGGICFYEFMPEVKKSFAGVYYDLAAAPYLYGPEIYGFISAFIQEKTLFGSDYPLLSWSRYERDMVGLDETVKERITHGNAERLLRGAGLG